MKAKNCAIIAKAVKGKEYLIKPYAITTLKKEDWERIHNYDYGFTDSEEYIWRYIPYDDTDFTWWERCSWKLTAKKCVPVEIEYHNGELELL